MATNFKKQVSQRRAAVPQVDPEGTKEAIPAPLYPGDPPSGDPQNIPEHVQAMQAEPTAQSLLAQPSAAGMYRITIVDTSEAPVNRGFFMYPSRHRQIAKDLAYLEDRKPWQIIEDALDEYVAKHYGEEYRRR